MLTLNSINIKKCNVFVCVCMCVLVVAVWVYVCFKPPFGYCFTASAITNLLIMLEMNCFVRRLFICKYAIMSCFGKYFCLRTALSQM